MAVATAPTVYGIETAAFLFHKEYEHSVATAPTVYGIETIGAKPDGEGGVYP